MDKGKKLKGIVVSSKMQSSAVVKVERFVQDKKYNKFLRRSKKYIVDNPEDKHKEGESVIIQECAPMSKNKSFKIIS